MAPLQMFVWSKRFEADAVMDGDSRQGLADLARLQAGVAHHFSAEEAWDGADDRAKAQALHRFLSAWLIAHIWGDGRNMVLRLSQQDHSTLTALLAALNALKKQTMARIQRFLGAAHRADFKPSMRPNAEAVA